MTALRVPADTLFPLPGSGLSLQVDNLLGDFGMANGVIAAKTETLANPAAQVRVFEQGKEVWKGWLFTRFPDTRTFAQGKYTLKLVALVPAK